MTWNPSPEVAVARDAAKKLGAKQVVILYFTDTQFGTVSYGSTKALCQSACKLGHKIFTLVDEVQRADIEERENP